MLNKFPFIKAIDFLLKKDLYWCIITKKNKTKKFKEPKENYVSKSSNHRKPGTRSRNAR